jgi:CO/xanthine dehydrogenase Mo-binding subunit
MFHQQSQIPVTSFCAQVAEVDVDAETGNVTVQQLYTVHDVGTIINDVTHQGQIDGGLIQGFGFALMEEMPVEEGRIVASHLGEFKLPTSADTPPLCTVLLGNGNGPAPFDGKAIGEIPNVPTAAAIVNAIHDAVGVRIYELPAAPEKILAALDDSQ